MRLSQLFGQTYREKPSDATAPSHELLLRGGYIRPLAAGIYSFLPLAFRTLRKVEAIIREEMDAIGADMIAVLLPITDERGITSTAIAHRESPWTQSRRLTMREACELPETFTAADLTEAGLNPEGVRRLLAAPWLPDMVSEILETPEFCEPEESSEQLLSYARDVVGEYIRKRFPL